MEATTARAAPRRSSRWRSAVCSYREDLFCVGLLVVLALCFVSPALKDGSSFGGFDLDTNLTKLGAGLYSVVHSHTNGDAVSQMVSWNALDWRLVHSGHFPLWNDYSVLGMPEFFNFESGVLSLPDLVSYLAPLPMAFLVAVFVKLVLAGVGTYVAARVLRLRPLAALFGGASYLLAGAFVNWVTWPLSDVFAWCGWLVAFAVLSYRTPRWRHVVALALSVAFSIFGGFPEASVMVALGLGALALGVGLSRLAHLREGSLVGLGRGAIGLVAGVALAAPLWLPGLQVIAASHRSHDGDYAGLPVKTLSMLLTQGYYGLPTGALSTTGFGLPKWNYYETASYVGVIGLLLALVALASLRRRPIVAGLLLAIVCCFLATYEPRDFHPFFSIVFHIPYLSAVRFERMRTMAAFLVALLGAVGLEELLTRAGERVVRRTHLAGALLLGAVVAVLGARSLGGAYRAELGAIHPPAGARLAPAVITTLVHQRRESLVWPALLIVFALGLGVLLFRGGGARARRLAGYGLVGAQVAYLFFAGVGIPSYSRLFYATTPAITQLERALGGGLLGLDNGNTGPPPKGHPGVRSFGGVASLAGLYPNINIGYGVRLLAVHDPLTPTAYYTSWPLPAAAPVAGGVGLFVPAITSAALARTYGVSDVLVAHGVAAPAGMTYVETITDERLYHVPGAARFGFTSALGRVSAVTDGGDGSYRLTTTSSAPGTLVLRVTALPGWHASIDGRAVPLLPHDQVMLALHVPAGRHTVSLTYLPKRLVEGLVLGALGLALLALLPLLAALRRRRGGAAAPSPEGPLS